MAAVNSKHHLPTWLFLRMHLFGKMRKLVQTFPWQISPQVSCVTTGSQVLSYTNHWHKVIIMVGLGQLQFAHEAWKSLASSQDKGHQIPEQNQNLVSVGEAGQWQECGQLTVTSSSNFLVIPLI